MESKLGKEEENNNVHIEQLVSGFIRFGDAGIDRKRKDRGYVCQLYTIDENGRFVDLDLKEEHLHQIVKEANNMLASIKNKEK